MSIIGIGDFARHGRVSVRMLRHYDAVGLLRPAQVDRLTGYRFYAAAQLARLNRTVALKELGFMLAQVQEILDEKVGIAELGRATGHGLRGRGADTGSGDQDDTAITFAELLGAVVGGYEAPPS